ncbi:MAG: sulfatase-like hydrolase/transferase, partial [Acidimicrobiia bacterium]
MSPQGSRPRFVIICIDALRADHVGCYRGDAGVTPHMDRLAAEGVRFANAISQASWTHPSVASIMTGLYHSQHVMTGACQAGDATKLIALSSDLPTLPGCLGEAGYATAAFVAGNAYLKPEFGITRGFGHLDFETTTDGAVVVEDFARWLAGAGDGPWAAYIHLMDVHSPLPQELFPTRPMVDRGVEGLAGADAADTLLGYYSAGV